MNGMQIVTIVLLLALPALGMAQGTDIARGSSAPVSISPGSIIPIVELEEDVYTYAPADNGAGPMWCRGNTCIVRQGSQVYASGITTLAEAKPLNNCLPLLFFRDPTGWQQVYQGKGRTREPCPLGVTGAGKILLSINPTLTPPDTYGGPAQPQILAFSPAQLTAYDTLLPQWQGTPAFTEHSYRSFAVDAAHNELVLFQNISYKHAEWAFQDQNGQWTAQGQLEWPWGAEYDKPQHIRICYPTVALRDHAVYVCGVSDIIEPYTKWRDFKQKLTGRKWDYDFRRLFFTWSEDISSGKFHDWIEIASRDRTCGWIMPQDLHVARNGDVWIMWTERALDERLRAAFFPAEKQRHSLEFAVLRQGHIIARTTLVEGGEGLGNKRPGDARFQVTENGRVFAFCHISDSSKSGNYLIEVNAKGAQSRPIPVRLKTPLGSFFVATMRAGNQPSSILDVLGNTGHTMRYARIRLKER
jgi:hypothetical protein